MFESGKQFHTSNEQMNRDYVRKIHNQSVHNFTVASQVPVRWSQTQVKKKINLGLLDLQALYTKFLTRIKICAYKMKNYR